MSVPSPCALVMKLVFTSVADGGVFCNTTGLGPILTNTHDVAGHHRVAYHSLQGSPALSRSQWHLQMKFRVALTHPGQRIHNGVDDGWRRPDRAQFANTFDTEGGVETRRRLVEFVHEIDGHISAWQGILHQACSYRLSGAAVVDHCLAQGLTQALHGAAIQLPAYDHRIEHKQNPPFLPIRTNERRSGLVSGIQRTFTHRISR